MYIELKKGSFHINVGWQPWATKQTLGSLSWTCLTVSSSVKQKRKGLKGSVDLEKIKCVEIVQPEPNAPQERMYPFQVDIFQSNFHY